MRKFLFLLIFLLAACKSPTASSQPARAETITCTSAYRADVTQPIEREETLTFGEGDDEQSVVFTDMVFHAAYRAGELDNERSLRLWVTDSTDSNLYQSQLYQLPIDSGPQNQFIGGHGFTGLNYSYVPDSAAELQFWCTADE